MSVPLRSGHLANMKLPNLRQAVEMENLARKQIWPFSGALHSRQIQWTLTHLNGLLRLHLINDSTCSPKETLVDVVL